MKFGRAALVGLLLAGLFRSSRAEYRTYDGSNNNQAQPNAGKAGTPFLRNHTALFVGDFQPIPSQDFANASMSCAAGPAAGNYPLGRCVSNMLMSYRTGLGDVSARQAFLSTEGRTHMVTLWGHMVSLDLADSSGSIPVSIPMPTDDAQYQSPGTNPLIGPLPFNVTQPMTGPGGQRIRTGMNMVTSFLDASFIYGSSQAVVQRLREPQGCRMRVSKGKDGQDYPPLQAQNSSRYDFGSTSTRAQDTLVALIVSMFLREHNAYCATLKARNLALSDDDAFEQTRAYIIALFQHFTYTEYLGMILGQTLQPPLNPDPYDATAIPGVDTFFATASFRYGHSELSDFYQIMDKNDQYLTTLSLKDLRNPRLIENYGFETIGRLCARQTQEEVDIYYSDETRNAINVAGRPFDLAQLDILRSRDHGLPLYNDARKLFGLPPVASFEELSPDPTIQQTLQSLYGSVDKVETIVGALLEKHRPGSNLGDLFWLSIYQQFWNIRASDRFWYTRPGVLEPSVLKTVQSTTLRSLMMRYFRDGTVLPENVWKHTHKSDAKPIMDNFQIQFTPSYRLNWATKSDSITFTMTVTGEVGWVGFGIGPNPNMAGALFYIVDHQKDGLMLQKYVSQGIATIPKHVSNIQSIPMPANGRPMVVSWSHPLKSDGLEITSTRNYYALYAQSTTTKQVKYHGTGDARGSYSVNFFTSAISSGLSNPPVNTHKFHGIGMFICWGVAFPFSAFIVRYHKHSLPNAINIHRYIQVLTGVSITSLATAAISTSTPGRGQAHKYVGVTILALVVGQVGLGLVVIYSLERIEHANRGVALVIKWMHRVMGTSLLLVAWFNIYLGMVAYPSPRRWIIAYLVYLAIIVIGVAIYHVYWHNTGRVRKGTKAIRVGDYLTPGNKQSLKKLPSSWPKMTWNEINDRVLSGAKLVVVDDYVFDIRSWINSHPGGAKVLQRVIGTDITADLYGHYEEERPAHHRSSEKGLLDDGGDMELSAMNTLRDSPSFHGSGSSQTGLLASQDFTTHAAANDGHSHARDEPPTETPSLTDRLTEKLRQLMRSLDRLNTNSTTTMRGSANQPLRRPLTTHAHSIRAISRIATYCIAVLDRNPKSDDLGVVGLSSSRRESSMLPTGGGGGGLAPSSGNRLSAQVTHRKRMSVAVVPVPVIQSNRVFHRYILTSKATVSHEHAPRPVRRFTFRSVQPWSSSDNVDLRKPFLPGDYVEIQCAAQGQVITRAYTPVEGSMEEFTLLVRIYPYGLVSRFLEDEFGKPAIQRVLLNPADPERGCWSLLLMVAGGTGLTPMLQLIQHHLHHAASLDRHFNMYLLYLNQSPKDIIAGPYLDTLVEQSNGTLHITYAIKEGVHRMATGCDGVELVGELNTKMLQQWLLAVAKMQRRRSGIPILTSSLHTSNLAAIETGRPTSPRLISSPTMGHGQEITHLGDLSNLSQPTSPAFPSQNWPSQQQQQQRPLTPGVSMEIQPHPHPLQQDPAGLASPQPPPIPPRLQQLPSSTSQEFVEPQQQQQQPYYPQSGMQSQSIPPPLTTRSSRTVTYSDLPSPGLPRMSSEVFGGAGAGDMAAPQERNEYWSVLCKPSSRLVISGPPRMMECASDGLNELRFPTKNRVLMA
ncbi:hypothetical protein BGZ73_001384 [Actinomortierella ambigua]|nr:hypothetical protein BGZ73_001384 [Actinomortierella ambigua]